MLQRCAIFFCDKTVGWINAQFWIRLKLFSRNDVVAAFPLSRFVDQHAGKSAVAEALWVGNDPIKWAFPIGCWMVIDNRAEKYPVRSLANIAIESLPCLEPLDAQKKANRC